MLPNETFREPVRKVPLIVVELLGALVAPNAKTFAPVIEELAKEYAVKFVFGKLNGDENPKVPTDLLIRLIPTRFILKRGDPVDVKQGALPKPIFRSKSFKQWL
uniref:Thioredoxin domain-containing protein n=1 Tax=Candidatus Methanophaga sp. ANME-1 ERB7 TaxID=2759913 RepID=A0A7G9Z537_9EURY|nr:hypothetical protein LFMFKLDH_00025 [Methanosarcinales archaeon ANME-1 ERB7]